MSQEIGMRNDTADTRKVVPFIELSVIPGGLATPDELKFESEAYFLNEQEIEIKLDWENPESVSMGKEDILKVNLWGPYLDK